MNKNHNSLHVLCKIVFCFIFLILSGPKGYCQDSGTIEAKYEKLKKEYDAVVKDRDNVLLQTKELIKNKSELQFKDNKIKKLIAYNEKLKQSKEEVLKRIDEFIHEIDVLNQIDLQKIEQIERLKKHIENMKIEYKIVDETKNKLKVALREKRRLEKEIQNLNQKLKKEGSHKLEAQAAAEAYRRKIRDLQKQYREALSINKQLSRKMEEMPRKFAEIARENKILIKETSLTHYNLGVFYTENKEHRRATAEFEKALELNPDDPYAHFNLGYIYAEYMVDRHKAIEHFRKFLRLAKRDDQDVDWAKQYILTWQAWEGRKPLK